MLAAAGQGNAAAGAIDGGALETLGHALHLAHPLMSACVIIPALRPDGTARALSLLGGQCESAVVIDNSAGPVEAAIRGFQAWVRILRPGQNIGFGAAVNLAAREAKEEVLILVNDDVEPHPDFVRRMTEPFRDPDVHQVSGLLYAKGMARLDAVGLSFDRTLRAENVQHVSAGRPHPMAIGPSGAAAAYRRRTFLELGGFASELFAYWEDADLALRFWAAGHPCVFAKDAVAEHARSIAPSGRSARQRELDAFGRGFVLGRYLSWLSPVDRLAVPVVDWPSLLRGGLITRSAAPIRARRAGMAAGRRTPVPKPSARPPATRSVLTTVRGQLATLR